MLPKSALSSSSKYQIVSAKFGARTGTVAGTVAIADTAKNGLRATSSLDQHSEKPDHRQQIGPAVIRGSDAASR